MEFLLCATRYLMSEGCEQVRYQVEHSMRNSISTCTHVLFSIYLLTNTSTYMFTLYSTNKQHYYMDSSMSEQDKPNCVL